VTAEKQVNSYFVFWHINTPTSSLLLIQYTEEKVHEYIRIQNYYLFCQLSTNKRVKYQII
jgi:hypothetical protein